jgi:hypothetical protein
MARLFYEVKYYRVHLGNGIMGSTSSIAWLDCLDASSDWSQELIIYFVPDGEKLPPSYCNISDKRGYIYRPISQMSLYLDILRNEKPVFVGMDDKYPDDSSVVTYPEPVGEGE